MERSHVAEAASWLRSSGIRTDEPSGGAGRWSRRTGGAVIACLCAFLWLLIVAIIVAFK